MTEIMKRLYFQKETGKIVGHDNCDLDDPPMNTHEGVDWIVVPYDGVPNDQIQVVDPQTMNVRMMTSDERRTLNAPHESIIRSIRRSELLDTDWRESDPPWKDYRQKLRDITKAGDVRAMIVAWPARPDGNDDAIAHLRS